MLGLVCVWLDGFGLATIASALTCFDYGGVASETCTGIGNNDIHAINIRLWMGARPNRGHRGTAIPFTCANLGCINLGLAWPGLAWLVRHMPIESQMRCDTDVHLLVVRCKIAS